MNHISDNFSVSLKWNSFYIRVRRVKFDIGWYRGNPFYLLQLNLFEVYENLDGVNLFYIQILKFAIGLSIHN